MKRLILNQTQSKSIFFYLFFIILIPIGNLYAQEKYELINGSEITLQSKILNEERVVTIYLPDKYYISTQKYPVLYLLDGKAHFHHATGAVSFLSEKRIIPEMIIVAIHNVDRNRDFTPIHDERFRNTGSAEKFLNFITVELKPYIDGTYRTSSFTILMGHSLGGVFITYSLLNKPEVFDAYIAISPYLQFADNHMVTETDSKLKTEYDSKKYFYMTVGNEPDYYSPLSDFSSLIKERTNGTIEFEYIKMEEENHASIPYITLFNGLRFIFSDWILPQETVNQGLSAIDEHYASLATIYDIEVKSPERMLNILGYTYLQNGDIENAIMVFKENVKRYPGSSNVYDSLGEAYENNNQLDLARENYQKAYDLGKEQDHVNTEIYLKNLNRVSQE